MQEDSFNGTWEAKLSYVKAHGLRDADWRPDFWQVVIEADKVRVFFRRAGSSELKESKAGKYQIHRHLTNAIVFAIDSGTDKDGVWVETEAFLLTQIEAHVLGVTLTGAVNNTVQPTSSETSKFFYVATGRFKRV